MKWLAALRSGITGGWTTIISTVARLALVVAEAVRNKQLMDAGEAKADARYSAAERERLDTANRARIDADDPGVLDPFDAANRRDLPGA